jgi:hypothetical protein
MSQQGTHTWDLVLQYHCCPECGTIIESREDFHYQMGSWLKEIQCTKCKKIFLVKKQQKLKFGPLLGVEQSPEWEWE